MHERSPRARRTSSKRIDYKRMPAEKPRRSWLIVTMSKPAEIEHAAKAGADVIVLDLVEFVVDKDKASARERVRSALATVSGAGGEVFAQIDPRAAEADLAACVWPGLSGIVVSRAERPQQITEISALLDRLEKERGIEKGTVKIVPALETAQGNNEAYEIARASDRVWGVTLGRADLVMDLRPEPSDEIHLMPYLMQRLIIVAGAAGVTPIGAWWRAPDRGLLATPENTREAARRGRAIGFKGAMCVRTSQVEPLNRAYA
jgi:citrate lyase subunit beta/citryl-CoA lyase